MLRDLMVARGNNILWTRFGAGSCGLNSSPGRIVTCNAEVLPTLTASMNRELPLGTSRKEPFAAHPLLGAMRSNVTDRGDTSPTLSGQL